MTLRTRIIAVAVIASLIVAIFSLAASWRSQKQIENRFEEATISGKAVLWQKIIASELDSMEAGSTGLTRDRDTITALSEGNLQSLSDSVSSTYNRLSTSKVLSKLQITDLQANVLFSAPQSFNGRTKKALVLEALREGKVKRGLQRDDDGQIVAIVTFPLYSRGQMAGAGVFSLDLKSAIEDFKLNDGSEVFITNLQGDQEYATADHLYKQLDITLPKPGNKALTKNEVDGKVYTVVAQPVKDPVGEPLGILISAYDNTESYNNQSSINMASYIGIIVMLGLIIAFLYWYTNRAFRPLHTAINGMNAIASGDLTSTFEAKTEDEIGQLLSAMKVMTEKLYNIISQITGSTAQLSSSAEELSAITIEANEGIKRQQIDIDQVATATNEMAATVQEVARNTQQAAEATQKANNEAAIGKTVVSETIDAIDLLAKEIESAASVIQKVETDSENIGMVLDVIRDIADQTNLLALNAAIEAARAGEQGRGFAVVADEVRTLASRTQQSTQEIQQTIQRLQNGAQDAVKVMQKSRVRAKASVEQATKAGTSLETISHVTGVMVDMNTQIASAAEQQSAVAEEINLNVTNISQVVEKTARGSHQTYLASQELAKLATDLQSLVLQFKV